MAWNDDIADGSEIDGVAYLDRFRLAAAERHLEEGGATLFAFTSVFRMGAIANLAVDDGTVLEDRVRLSQNALLGYAGFIDRVPDDDEPYAGPLNGVDAPWWTSAYVYTESTFAAAAFGDTGPTRKYFKRFADKEATEYLDGNPFADGDHARCVATMRTYHREGGQWVWARATLPDVVTVVSPGFAGYPDLTEVPSLRTNDLIDSPLMFNQLRDGFNALYVWSWVSAPYVGATYESTDQGLIGGGSYTPQTSYALALAQAAAVYGGDTPRASHQAAEAYVQAGNYGDGTYNVYPFRARGTYGPANVYAFGGQNRDITFYSACPPQFELGGDPGADTYTFDANGDPVVNGCNHAFDNRIVQADATSIMLGNLGLPNMPAAPASGTHAFQGYTVFAIPYIVRGDIAGGFGQSSTVTT